ncbi:MAG: hypothetical protein JWO84_447 [Parcubacteria group bacterium]|nr:hypothetical protein [Parcubacteria group bacterium]
MWKRYLIVLLAFVIASGAAYEYYWYQREHSSLSDHAQVRMTVSNLGDVLQQVPLIAPPDIVAFAMNKYYALYVRPDLLAQWEADPLHAPGRLTSSPWPDRIDTTSATKNKDGTYTVDATIVELANGAQGPQTADTIHARFTLSKGPDGWQITHYEKL